MTDLNTLVRAAEDNHLRRHLEQLRTEQLKIMSQADGASMYRAQGGFNLVEKLLNDLDKAKSLR